MNSSSTTSLLSSSAPTRPHPHHPLSHTQKDYFAAFGDLQSRYGMGGLVRGSAPGLGQAPPSRPTTHEKNWFKWRDATKSSSSPSPSSSPFSTPPSHYTPLAESDTRSRHTHADVPPREYEHALGELMVQYGHGQGHGPSGTVGYARCRK